MTPPGEGARPTGGEGRRTDGEARRPGGEGGGTGGEGRGTGGAAPSTGREARSAGGDACTSGEAAGSAGDGDRAAGGEAWSTGDVAEYERTRYRNLDQRLVDRLERGALESLVGRAARPGDRVLDMPSGYGRLTEIAAGRDRRVVAADRSREMLRSSRRKARGRRRREARRERPLDAGRDAPPEVRQEAETEARRNAPPEARRPGRREARPPVAHCTADARSLPFRDRAFDGVICVRLVQHLADPVRREVFRELRRVTRRWAVVSVYRKAGLHHLQRRLLGRGRMCVSLGRIREELEDAGLRVERVAKPLPVLHAQTLLLLGRR